MEDDKDRMVKTPWYEDPIPFTKAAHIGTQKVIRDHSTIGLVITTDGSFGEIAGESFAAAEEMAVGELKQIGKPFIVVVNTIRPYAMETQELCRRKEEKYDIKCLPFNCDQLKQEDIQKIMATMLLEFPVSQIDFYTPKWFDLLPERGKSRRSGRYSQRISDECSPSEGCASDAGEADLPIHKEMLY